MQAGLRCVAPVGDKCGEAATWHAPEQALYWVDLQRFLIHRYDLATQSTRSWHFDEPPVALSLTRDPDWFLVALASRLIYWNPRTDARMPHGFVLEGSPAVRLNDGRSDPAGNFWVGSMKNNIAPDGSLMEAGKGLGKLFRITPTGDVSVWREGLGISNTLCWSPDAKHFYFGDTLENTIYRYRYARATAAISEETAFFTGDPRGAPDGSSMDSAGNLWNCRFGGRGVICVSPEGKVLKVIALPVSNATTCCFGGPDLKTLFITTASIVSPESDRLAGSLFAIAVDVPGQPENHFAGKP
ncbi:MAG: SMP-30/gluconolactonase/LRE family protein [Hyphomicrobiales bacterium]